MMLAHAIRRRGGSGGMVASGGAGCQYQGRGVELFWQPVKGTIAEGGGVGRAWSARELRGKSFEDLQKLWVVLLQEKNRLLTERQAFRSNNQPWPTPSRLWKVKKSMARLKLVVHERKRHTTGPVPDNQYVLSFQCEQLFYFILLLTFLFFFNLRYERSRLHQDMTFYASNKDTGS